MPSQPRCVVEYGEAERLTRTAHILRTLSAKLPGVVPAVVSCTPCPDGRYVLIQEGLGGVPWFRVADTVTSAAAWRALLARTLETMTALHHAVRSEAAWLGSFNLAMEVERQCDIASRTNVSLSPAVLQLVRECRPYAVPMVSFSQHGDYSLNNLLVDRRGISVIDFDEFGLTMAPLHDAFGLALSFALSQEVPTLPRVEVIRECLRAAVASTPVDRALWPGLLLHHLLLRINQCHGSHRRARLRRILLDWTDELARTPQAFIA
jgi:aminoglycoside phosphotransferase (APT) family kinase protein